MQPKIERFVDLLVLFKVYTFTTFFSVQKQISKRDQETWKEASKRKGDKNQPINLIKTHFLVLSVGPVSYKPRRDLKKYIYISKTKRARALKLAYDQMCIFKLFFYSKQLEEMTFLRNGLRDTEVESSIASKIYVTPDGDYLPISKLYSILAVHR